MEATLREITDAMWASKTGLRGKDERQQLYDRGRMLRDRKLIHSSNSQSQGKTTTFTDADIAAAVVVITASLNGMSWGIIQAHNDHLRRFGNTTGHKAYERFIADIAQGVPVYARINLISGPFASHDGQMGGADILNSFSSDANGNRYSQVLIWPVTDLVKPVLDVLKAR